MPRIGELLLGTIAGYHLKIFRRNLYLYRQLSQRFAVTPPSKVGI